MERDELTALLQEHGLTRDVIDSWLSQPITSALSDLRMMMVCWRCVEIGTMTYEGNGYFRLV